MKSPNRDGKGCGVQQVASERAEIRSPLNLHLFQFFSKMFASFFQLTFKAWQLNLLLLLLLLSLAMMLSLPAHEVTQSKSASAQFSARALLQKVGNINHLFAGGSLQKLQQDLVEAISLRFPSAQRS